MSVAALLAKTNLRGMFFDKQEEYSWHAGMQLAFATIQNSHIRDLVSLADPTNPYSFHNFLYQTGRLEAHTTANFQNIMRWKFEQYLRWVIHSLDYIKLGHVVEEILPSPEGFAVQVSNKSGKKTLLAKNITLGTGVVPFIPECAKKLLGSRLFHNSEYLFYPKTDVNSITVVGGGQSALEIVIDLLTNHQHIQEITLIYKEPLISQIEDSQFAEDQIFTTAGLQNFFNLKNQQKNTLLSHYRLTSDGASPHSIQQLYQLLYTNQYLNKNPKAFNMLNSSQVCDIQSTANNSNQGYTVTVENLISHSKSELNTDMIILASGYAQQFPFHLFSSQILDNVELDKEMPKINFNYEIEYEGTGSIFVLNGAKHSHGVVDPNLSLNAVRAYQIVDSVSKSQHNISYCPQSTFTRII